MRVVFLVLLLVVSSAVFALPVPSSVGASWKPVELKYYWDRVGSGFCRVGSSCLVNNAFNESLDGQPDSYWSGVDDGSRPKCIDDGQYIGDHLCVDGSWSSRTRVLAEWLVKMGLVTHGSFSVYCDSYDAVFNRFDYDSQFGAVEGFLSGCSRGAYDVPCVNNACVLDFSGGVVFATSLNVPVDGDSSFLLALNKSRNLCSGVSGSGFSLCGGDVYFDPSFESVIVSPVWYGSILTPVSPFFEGLFGRVNAYVFSDVHDPSISLQNYSFFNVTPSFSRYYFARKGSGMAFGFKEVNVTPARYDYVGVYYANLSLPPDSCSRKVATKGAFCKQSADELFVVGRKIKISSMPSIADDWPDLLAKTRVVG